MKNKETIKKKASSKKDTVKGSSKNNLAETNVNYDEVKQKLKAANMQMAQPLQKETKKGPSKTQIERLKKFYNTTRWLPNSAFTTYFGKPAFENYGYGNINPVYGGLFYGNYMLSHNMNPIDGQNHPDTKQVYSSAMMKSLQRKELRRPSPPRKVPEEIRNTPEELQEIRTRAQIFQLPNNFPSRDIIPPNLLKARYFRSGKNTPVNSEDENEDEYEDWNIENVLSGKKNKKMKIHKKADVNFNPYSQGRVELKKKKMKESLDNKFSEEFYKKTKGKYFEGEEGEDVEESEGQLYFERQKEYYMKMLGENAVKNLEDLTNMEVKEENIPLEEQKENPIEQNGEVPPQDVYMQHDENRCNWTNCPICHKAEYSKVPTNPLKKKENPALLPPSGDLLKMNNDQNFVCCMHHSQLPFNQQEKDPKNYQGMPPCMMASVVPAGKPSHLTAPLNIFH